MAFSWALVLNFIFKAINTLRLGGNANKKKPIVLIRDRETGVRSRIKGFRRYGGGSEKKKFTVNP